MASIADWIVRCCRDGAEPEAVRKEVRDLCLAHPTPSGLAERA